MAHARASLPQTTLDALAHPRRPALRPAFLWAPGAVAAAAAIAFGFIQQMPPTFERPHQIVSTYTSPADAESRVALSDGSVALLHRGSQIAFGQFAERREARLLSGEAHFTVAKTSSAPFFVHAGQLTIRDIGTAFNLRLDPDRVAVLVTAGSVAVRNLADGNLSQANGSTDSAAPDRRLTIANRGAARPGEQILTAGQQAVAETTLSVPSLEVSAPASAEVEQTLAWKSRRIRFDRTPLSAAVDKLNRYNVRQLSIGDSSLRTLEIGGGGALGRPRRLRRTARIRLRAGGGSARERTHFAEGQVKSGYWPQEGAKIT